MAEWKLLAPHTFFDEGLVYDTHALYQLPTLRQKCPLLSDRLYQLYVDLSSGRASREDFDCESSNFLFTLPSRLPPLSHADDAKASPSTCASFAPSSSSNAPPTSLPFLA